MTKHIIHALPQATAEQRAHVEAVQREADAFVASDRAADLPDFLASLAVHAVHELPGVLRQEPLADWSTLSYQRLLATFPAVSMMQPLMVPVMLAAWHAYALWLRELGRIDTHTCRRLIDELDGGGDRFMDTMLERYENGPCSSPDAA